MCSTTQAIRSTPRLLEEVERRAHSGCDFTLIVPPERHPHAPDWTAEEALELIGRATASHGFPDERVRIEVGPLT